MNKEQGVPGKFEGMLKGEGGLGRWQSLRAEDDVHQA